MENDSRSVIEEKIKQILITELEVNPETIAKSNSTTPLLGRGIGLDSIEALALVAAIEKEFNIQLEDDEIKVDLFRDTGTLAEYILQRTRY
jgi:acyl carrier protein